MTPTRLPSESSANLTTGVLWEVEGVSSEDSDLSTSTSWPGLGMVNLSFPWSENKWGLAWGLGLWGPGGLDDGLDGGGGGGLTGNGTWLLGNRTVGFARIRFCTEWEGAQHSLFQAANLFLAAAFLIPHNFRQSVLIMRFTLSVGFLLAMLWAALSMCAPDALAWNAAFCAANLAHALIIAYRLVPTCLRPDLVDLYLKVFQPLKVNKQHFRDMTRDAQLLTLEPGETYAVEEITPVGPRLSILLRGKLRVTCEQTHLHYILPNQFVDSPEWEACPDDSDDVFQVTVTAEEQSVYLCWPRRKMRSVLEERPHLEAVMYNLVGKDITQKLYSLNEHLGPSSSSGGGASASSQDGDGAGRRQGMNRSLSVDAVDTGTKGHVRSQFWRLHHPPMPDRRASSIYSNTGSSPARSLASTAFRSPRLLPPSMRGGQCPMGGHVNPTATNHPGGREVTFETSV